MEEIWNLRQVHLLQGLTPLQMDEVLRIMPVASFRKNEYIFMAGDEADALYVVQLGTVKVAYVDLNGEEKILDIFQAGDIFGYLFLGRYRQRIGNAQALSDVVLCRLTEVDFINLIQRFPVIALNFIRQQSDEYRETNTVSLRTGTSTSFEQNNAFAEGASRLRGMFMLRSFEQMFRLLFLQHTRVDAVITRWQSKMSDIGQ